MANTRFNPTTNGGLHLGHIYMALVNQYEAESTGGQFVVRFADSSRFEMGEHGGADGMLQIANLQRAELSRLGIEPAYYRSELEDEWTVKQYIMGRTRFQPVVDNMSMNTYETAPHVTAFKMIAAMRMQAWITAQKVACDYVLDDCDTIIRGVDLLAEHQLYMYFCALFGFPFPKCYYLPRLMVADSDGALSNVSKTAGNWSMAELWHNNVSPERIRNLLDLSCKKDPDGPWSIGNIKDVPAITAKDVSDIQ